MYKNILAVAIILFLSSCSFTKNNFNSLTDKEKREGWKLLFDGKTTNGWHLYGQNSPGTFWKVSDGALYPDVENGNNYDNSQKGDLTTDEEFGNFHLKMEWRISPKGNSGIIFYVAENAKNPSSYMTGPEMQVLDNGTPIKEGHSDAKIYTHRAGDLYDLLASKDAAKPQGEWNEVEIVSKDGQLDFYMNGVHTLSITLWNQYWMEMIAISKFKNMPDFGKSRKGKIALQYHRDAVWFRNIKIREL